MDGGLHATVFALTSSTVWSAVVTAVPVNNGINRIVCPTPNTVLVATAIGLFFSKDGGLNFGANEPDFNDGQPIRGGFISALALRQRRHHPAPHHRRHHHHAHRDHRADHGFQNDDRVYIGGVVPARNVNGSWIVDRIDDNHFSLRNSLGGRSRGRHRGLRHRPGASQHAQRAGCRQSLPATSS